MPFPGSSDYPDSVDTAYGSGVARVDGVDVVYDDDYNFPDLQIRRVQTYLGTSGQLIGQGVANKGPGGLLSPLADGGGVKALRLAARNAFSLGDILSVGDAYDTSYTEKMRLDADGLLWTLAGLDIGAAEFLRIPHGTSFPASFDEGRLFYRDDIDGLYMADGSAWNPVNPSAVAEYDWVSGYGYAQQLSPVEETMAYGRLDGSDILGTAYFRASWEPYFSAVGWARVRLYDVGPEGGPPAAPVLITTLELTTSGLSYDEQALSIGASPGSNQIANSGRVYEVTVEQDSAAGDTVFVGSAGISDR